MQENPVCYWELASHDAKKSVEFFEKVFDWEMEYDENTTIHELPVDGSGNDFWGGGIFTLRKARLPFLTVYLKVEDIEAKAELVMENGGEIIEPVQSLPSGSKICLFTEPSGVTFAMLEPVKK